MMMDAKKEIAKLLAKKSKLFEAHMNKYRNHSATRAQTTTYNARASDINERIHQLRVGMKETP
jgi:hypothetical protein